MKWVFLNYVVNQKIDFILKTLKEYLGLSNVNTLKSIQLRFIKCFKIFLSTNNNVNITHLSI